MSDIYVPGLRSRFNSEQIVEDLMRLERVPGSALRTTLIALSWKEAIGRT